MAQGWAGNQAPAPTLNCAICIVREDRAIPAVTQVKGTLTCLQHAKEYFSGDGEQW